MRVPSDPAGEAARLLRRVWPAVLAGDADAVHRARVATRRLREILPMLEGHRRAAKKLRRDVRAVTQALGPVRELDVAIGLIIRLTHDDPFLEAPLETVRVALMDARLQRRRVLQRRIDMVEVAGIAARLIELAREVKDGTVRRIVDRVQLRARLASRASALHDAVDGAGALYAPEPLHAVRIGIKKLRYAVEVARLSRLAGAATGAIRLYRFQDHLGEWHDWQVLSGHVARVQTRLPVGDPHVADLTALLASLEDRCRALHAEFITERNDLLALCDEIAITAGTPSQHAPR
jgi:CHAD domain-containing protein